jgi:hypothetical protein
MKLFHERRALMEWKALAKHTCIWWNQTGVLGFEYTDMKTAISMLAKKEGRDDPKTRVLQTVS